MSLEARADVSDYNIFGTQFSRFIEGLKNHSVGIVGNNIFGFNSSLSIVKTKEDFMSIRHKTVYRPLNLASKSKMLDFTKVVKDNFDAQSDIETRVLAPWRGILANFLTNPETLNMLYNVKDLDNGKLIKFTDVAKLNKAVKKVFTASNTQPTAAFGDLYGNVKEWTEVTKTTAQLNEDVVSLDFNGIVSQINELYEMADRLAGYIGSGDERYTASRSALELLTEASYKVGQELEFLGATGTMLDTLSGAIASTIEVLKK